MGNIATYTNGSAMPAQMEDKMLSHSTKFQEIVAKAIPPMKATTDQYQAIIFNNSFVFCIYIIALLLEFVNRFLLINSNFIANLNVRNIGKNTV